MSNSAHITREDLAEINENVARISLVEGDSVAFWNHANKAELYRDIEALDAPLGERTR